MGEIFTIRPRLPFIMISKRLKQFHKLSKFEKAQNGASIKPSSKFDKLVLNLFEILGRNKL